MILLSSMNSIRSKLSFLSYNLTSNFGKFQIKRLSEKAIKEDVAKPVKFQINPSDFQKRILVWTKLFKNTSDVPSRISPELLDKAYNKARIKTCNYMIAIVLIGCMYNAYLGRKAKDRGESLHSKNINWHKQIKEAEAENLEKQGK